MDCTQSVEFSRPEYWNGQPFPSSGDLSNPGIEHRSPALWVDSLPAKPQGKPKNTGVGSLSLLQGIFLTQESNWGLLHCRWVLYQLSYHLISINSPDAQGCWENGGRQRRLFSRQTQCDQHVGSPAELRTEDPAEQAGRHPGKWMRIQRGSAQSAWRSGPDPARYTEGP